MAAVRSERFVHSLLALASSLTIGALAPASSAITADPFGPNGEGGLKNGQQFLIGSGGSVFEVDGFLSLPGVDLNGGAFGSSAQLSADPLPAGLHYSFTSMLSADSTDITLSYVFSNQTGNDLLGMTFLSFVDADIDEMVNGFLNERAFTSGALAAGQNFEVDEPSFFGDIFDNLLLGSLDGTNALGPAAPEDVSMALSFEVDLADQEVATFQIQLSEDGDQLGSFAVTHLDDDPASTTEITYSGQAMVAPIAVAGAGLDLNEMAALLALPFFAHDGTRTDIVITNGIFEPIRLYIHVINGDEGEGWEASSFSCNMTARETTHFVFTYDGSGGSYADFECSTSDADETSPLDELNIPRSERFAAERGIMLVAVEQGDATISKNAIFGDATVIDAEAGSAWSVGGITFQGLDPLSQDGDRQYRFDGLEYASFPSALATNFLAPDSETAAELLLFTLDGTPDQTPVPASLRVLFYNDDERESDANLDVDCFDVISLEDVDPRLNAASLGSRAGHLTLEPRIVDVHTVHDFTGAGADGIRKTPVHGWMIQTISSPDGGVAAMSRSLVQGTTAHVGLAGDIVNFDAR